MNTSGIVACGIGAYGDDRPRSSVGRLLLAAVTSSAISGMVIEVRGDQ